MTDFWKDAEVISRYTRRQAIEDGVLVDLMQSPTPEMPDLDDIAATVREAGFRLPLAMTATAFVAAVAPIDGDLPPTQDFTSRLWDVLMVLRGAIRRYGPERDTVPFAVSVWRQKGYEGARRTGRTTVHLKAVCGPGDDGSPCITIMLPNED